ncbi:hypothetical protein Tco_1164723 [Tanacetum coccineum]
MAAGSRDRPPMLAIGRYAQWKLCFLIYIGTRPNGDVIRSGYHQKDRKPSQNDKTEHGMEKTVQNQGQKGPYKFTTATIPAVPRTDDSLASEKEAIHLLLTRIRDEIYSIIEACKIAHDMWIAIKRLQQGESLNIQDVKTNLIWKFRRFTSHDGETMESYYSRFYKMMNEMVRNNLTVAMMQDNVQFLQQLQPEWSRFVTIVKKNHDLDTVSYHKLFDILKQYQKEVNGIRSERIARNANPLALVAAAQLYPDPYFQEWQETKRVIKDYTYHKEKMLLCKQGEKGVPLQAEQANWLEDTYEEIDEQELEAHYSYMEKIQEDDSNVIPDSSDMCDNDIQNDQNAEECDDERDALANLIAEIYS